MAVTQQLETVRQMYRDFAQKTQAISTIEELRAAAVEFLAPFQPAADVRREPVDVGGIPGEWIVTPGATEDKVLLYLHGGGHAFGSVNTHCDMMSRISRAAGVKALGINYRLAPENPFPAGVEDATAAYRWLVSYGVSPSKIVIGGDSSGGGLTLSTLVALRDGRGPMPAAGVCMSPWVDLEGVGESMTTKAHMDPFVQRESIQFLAGMYIGDRDPRMPLAAPLYADLHGLPPLFIQVSTEETLLDDSVRFAARAREAGVEVVLDEWEDMVHDFEIFAPILPEAQQAIERVGEFIRQRTS